MVTEIEYETKMEMAFAENADVLKEQMEVLGWTCVKETAVEPTAGRIRLEFRRIKE